MDPLQIDAHPKLRSPVAVVAFGGWNDAASAATGAARFLTRRLAARRFASIDPEPFFNFSATRPHVRITMRGSRVVEWPQNDLFYARTPDAQHDLLVGIGVEPSLRWKTFSSLYRKLFAELDVSLVVSLGALLADVPHTREVPVNGSAADPGVAAKLRLTMSRYEGPTGILGVLHDSLRRGGTPAASLWANVPHYVTTDQNPPATLALLRRLQVMMGLKFDFADLESASERFIQEVNAAISSNEDLRSYVRGLEHAIDEGEDDDEEQTERPELPPSEEVVMDVEDFLRGQRNG